MSDAPEPDDAGDEEAWPDAELLEVHELNELGAGIGGGVSADTLDGLTKAELIDLAKSKGIHYSGMTKAELRAELEDA